eukprot:TRINITY_DN10712_c0_g2_i1.p1 TRINITY_DN10712_c0_g2~~TRINITY_DN10712_c0_g2_i1.p1  ORF type:complete len:328 (-),score=52.44 TRINITY_DN10712_c0_g2_i1:485-1468(-)
MEEKPICRLHSKPLQMFYRDCKELACLKCFPSHKAKGCSYPIPLPIYAEEEILPIYKAALDNLRHNAQRIEEATKDFLLLSKSIKSGLLKLKDELEALLAAIDKSLELFEENENGLLMTEERIEKSLLYQYEELKQAIDNEDASYIKERIDKPFTVDIGDSEKHLVKAINESIKKLEEVKEMSALRELLNVFNSKYELFIDSYNNSDTKCKFVYGICNLLNYCQLLCKYDIQTNKLIPVITMPKFCSVIQIAARVFTSGGYDPFGSSGSLTKEYIEKRNELANRVPMNCRRYAHALQKISNGAFAAIGGFYNKPLVSCEQYLISTNK